MMEMCVLGNQVVWCTPTTSWRVLITPHYNTQVVTAKAFLWFAVCKILEIQISTLLVNTKSKANESELRMQQYSILQSYETSTGVGSCVFNLIMTLWESKVFFLMRWNCKITYYDCVSKFPYNGSEKDGLPEIVIQYSRENSCSRGNITK